MVSQKLPDGRMGGRRAHRGVWILSVLALILVSGTGESAPPASEPYPAPVPLRVAGLIGDSSGNAVVVSPDEAEGVSYLPGSNVLRLPDGGLRYVPPGSGDPITVPPGDPAAKSAVASSREWLDGGTVPGETATGRAMAERALLDLRLLMRANGAVLAAPNPGWSYVWPRDASWAAVAFAATGHHDESYRILTFLATAQNEDGAWEARHHPDDGAPVEDGRPPQLDAVGWFSWAVWYWFVTAPESNQNEERIRNLWPAVRDAADAASASLGPFGLPPGGADYWETRTWRPNLGTAAPLLTGLRSAADLAERLGHDEDARRYVEAAIRLDAAIEREFAPHGYPRTTYPGSGVDSAVNFLAPPFAPPEPAVEKAVKDTAARLTTPNGGVLPGEAWRQDPNVSWTPETAFFALSAAARGDEESAGRWLGWLADHRTSLGAFPEKVDGSGQPKAAAPLGWTTAIVVLTLAARDGTLPIPPVPEEH